MNKKLNCYVDLYGMIIWNKNLENEPYSKEEFQRMKPSRPYIEAWNTNERNEPFTKLEHTSSWISGRCNNTNTFSLVEWNKNARNEKYSKEEFKEKFIKEDHNTARHICLWNQNELNNPVSKSPYEIILSYTITYEQNEKNRTYSKKSKRHTTISPRDKRENM